MDTDDLILPVCARIHDEVSSSNKRKVALRDLLLLPRTQPPPSVCVPLPPLLSFRLSLSLLLLLSFSLSLSRSLSLSLSASRTRTTPVIV